MKGWLYHATEEAKIFQGVAYEQAIAEGWVDSPKRIGVKTETAKPVDEREMLLAQAEARGIAVDKRWGVKRLQEALA